MLTARIVAGDGSEVATHPQRVALSVRRWCGWIYADAPGSSGQTSGASNKETWL
jgi:hypothetical protein